MPLKPVTNTLHLPLSTEQDVRDVFEQNLRIAEEPSRSRRGKSLRDLADHFYYIGAVLPSFAVPLQTEFVRLKNADLIHFDLGLAIWLYLLQGAEDAYVEALLTAFDDHFTIHEWWDRAAFTPQMDFQQNTASRIRRDMLAAIGTPAAMTALAELSRRYDWARYLRHIGVDVPASSAPARARFTSWRNAVQAVPFTGSEEAWRQQPNPIGLPLSTVRVPGGEPVITWHYLSVATALLPSIPSLGMERLHLVGPRRDCCWTLYGLIRSDGRYAEPTLLTKEDEEVEDWDLTWMQEREQQTLQVALLLPFDDKLTYCNGHVQNTEGVYGYIGGPPNSLYPPPVCRQCGILMFHVLTVEAQIHEYGDAWRSLFVCETCRVAASKAINWN